MRRRRSMSQTGSATRSSSRPRPAGAGAACASCGGARTPPRPSTPARRRRGRRSAPRRFTADPVLVEVQVLGDKNGIRVHLGERECSVQRRHQKLLEESPAPNLGAETRAGLHRAALTVAAAVNYMSAGTVEFIVDAEGRHYFIEMNTRIQVEHPVTEMVTGIDLVREQIRIADGEGLGYRQDAVRFEGHAIECRINAEDPETFAPSAGRITAWVPP